ncbi:acyl CoA binding protein-domain-containing protein [Xylariaceae sp. FL1651]|nr:acyl CoA binding protein-domain-containing protein [Xylariaceae sp. FL1651]
MPELSENEKQAFAQNPAFDKAANRESKQLTSKPDTNDLLELYGLYKVGVNEDITPFRKGGKKAPGMFDMKGKYKLEAWEKIVSEGLTQDQAQERYIAKVEALKEKCGFDANKEPETVGSSA